MNNVDRTFREFELALNEHFEFGGLFRFPVIPPPPVPVPALPVPLFRPTPSDPFIASTKMDTALRNAIAATERARRMPVGSYPIRFMIAEITEPAGNFPSAGFNETVTDYIASEAKVPVMYAAYALRDMAQRFAEAIKANPANLFFRLKKQMDPAIVAASVNVARSLVMHEHRVPSYPKAFVIQPFDFAGLRATAAFSPALDKALESMIVPSNNTAAGVCVRSIGYGYLNGSLKAGGFFDESNNQGLWVAGDYGGGKIWPYIRVVSKNDGFAAQAGTARDMAKLVALIMTNRILDPQSCDEMRGRLARAAKGPDTPFIKRTRIFKDGTITHNKLGLGPLKSGKSVLSEVSVYQSPVATGRRYVVAWQNASSSSVQIMDIATIIKATLTEYERP